MIALTSINELGIDDRWHILPESAKMGLVGGLLCPVPFDLWRTILATPEQKGVVDMLVRMHEQSDERMRDLTRQVGSLDGHIRLLNSNLERYSKIPERMERVERFVWVVSLIAAFIGVILGGVGQRVISDSLSKPIKHEDHANVEPVSDSPSHQGA